MTERNQYEPEKPLIDLLDNYIKTFNNIDPRQKQQNRAALAKALNKLERNHAINHSTKS